MQLDGKGQRRAIKENKTNILHKKYGPISWDIHKTSGVFLDAGRIRSNNKVMAEDFDLGKRLFEE